jgi:hypothetical protein
MTTTAEGPKKNRRVQALLDVSIKTPELAANLLEKLSEFVNKAPPNSSEAQARAQIEALGKKLREYTAVRKVQPFESKERQNAHSELCHTYNNTVSYIMKLSSGMDIALKAPTTVDLLYGFMETVPKEGRWAFSCCGCGGYRHHHNEASKSDVIMVLSHPYCKGCVDRYTSVCPSCSKRMPNEGKDRGHTVIYNNGESPNPRDESQAIFCRECRKGVKFDFTCGSCSMPVVGEPGNGRGIDGKALREALGMQFCYRCSSVYHKAGGCGHVTTHPRALINLENVEDDSREREEIRNDRQEFCEKCFNAATKDLRPVHWNQKRPSVVGKSYLEVGSERSFGVELEICQTNRMDPMPETMKAVWTSKRDASLPEMGVEMASTVLFGDAGLKVIKDLCDYAKANKWAADARAGFHLHVGISDQDPAITSSIAMGYHLTYDLWTSFVAPSRRKCKYCKRNGIPADSLQKLEANQVLRAILSDSTVEGRRVWVNWHSLSNHGTVEIRLHHGTIDYAKISNWVKAHTRFIDWCAGIADHKKIHEFLRKKSVRDQFLAISKVAWKDNELARWLRDRAQKLHGVVSPLPPSDRAIRKAGQNPKQPVPVPKKPGAYPEILGRPARVAQLPAGYMVVDPSVLRRTTLGPNGWSEGGNGGYSFSTRTRAAYFIEEVTQRFTRRGVDGNVETDEDVLRAAATAATLFR